MQTALMIPSRGRAERMPKMAQHWQAARLTTFLFVEPQQYDEYCETVPDWVNLIRLTRNDAGIGWARQQMLEHAAEEGLTHPVFSDDDIAVPEDVATLAAEACRTRAAGVGVYFRIYRHFMGLEKGTGTHAVTGGMGTQCFALDLAAARNVGGFDTSLRSNLEDSDLILRLIAAGHGPWAVCTDVEGGHVGTRYQPGGIDSLPGDNAENLRQIVEYLQTKHPGVVSLTAKGGSRIAWKKHYLNHGYDWPLTLER